MTERDEALHLLEDAGPAGSVWMPAALAARLITEAQSAEGQRDDLLVALEEIAKTRDIQYAGQVATEAIEKATYRS